MGNSPSIGNNRSISFVIKPIIIDSKNNKKYCNNDSDIILEKCKSQIKSMVKWGLSILGGHFKNSINFYTNIRVDKIDIKNNSIHVKGTIKRKKGKDKDKYITEKEYANHVKDELVRASMVTYPISIKYKKKTYNIFFDSVEKILFKPLKIL